MWSDIIWSHSNYHFRIPATRTKSSLLLLHNAIPRLYATEGSTFGHNTSHDSKVMWSQKCTVWGYHKNCNTRATCPLCSTEITRKVTNSYGNSKSWCCQTMGTMLWPHCLTKLKSPCYKSGAKRLTIGWSSPWIKLTALCSKKFF